MKILLVTSEEPNRSMNGISRVVQEYSRALKSRDEVKILSLQMHPFVPTQTEEEAKTLTGAQWADYSIVSKEEWFSEHEEGKHLLAAHYAYHNVNAILDEFKPDVVHLHGAQVWFPFRYEKNLVVTFHDLMRNRGGAAPLNNRENLLLKLEWEALARAQSVVVHSQFMARVLKESYGREAQVVPLGINASNFSAKKATDKFVVSFFGHRANPRKGLPAFLEAIHDLPETAVKESSLEFRVYGDGAIPAGLPVERLSEVKYLQDKALYAAYAGSHIVVMPSVNEPFGLVGLEALASGCVLLAPSGQGMDDYLVEGQNFLDTRPEPRAIREGILQVLQDKERFFGKEKERSGSVKAWTWDRSVEAHRALYEGVLAEQGKKEPVPTGA